MSLLLAAAASAWVVTDYKDPITDQVEATASFEYGGIGIHVTCAPKFGKRRKFKSVQVSTQQFLGSDGTAIVHFRFDDGKPDFGLWRFDRKSVWTDLPDQFLDEMRNARKLTLRIVDYRDHPYDIIFKLPQDFSAVDRVYSPCQ